MRSEIVSLLESLLTAKIVIQTSTDEKQRQQANSEISYAEEHIRNVINRHIRGGGNETRHAKKELRAQINSLLDYTCSNPEELRKTFRPIIEKVEQLERAERGF